MTLFQDVDPRFRGLNAKVTVFAVVALLAGGALLLTLAFQQGYFTSKSKLHVEAPTGADLRSGMAVKLSGFKIGEVSRVELNEQARVDIQLKIEDRYLKWLKPDSRVSIAREGFIGDSFLVVTSGNPRNDSLKEGDSLVWEASPALADLAQDMRNRILPVIDGTTKLLDYFNDPKSDFRVAMVEMRKLATDFHKTRQRLDTLLDDVDAVARNDVRKTLSNADRTLATIEKDMDAINARTDASLAKLDETLASAKATAEEAQKTAQAATKAIDDASPRVNRVIDNTGKAVQETRQLIDGAGKRWPFKGGELPPEEVPAAK